MTCSAAPHVGALLCLRIYLSLQDESTPTGCLSAIGNAQAGLLQACNLHRQAAKGGGLMRRVLHQATHIMRCFSLPVTLHLPSHNTLTSGASYTG